MEKVLAGQERQAAFAQSLAKKVDALQNMQTNPNRVNNPLKTSFGQNQMFPPLTQMSDSADLFACQETPQVRHEFEVVEGTVYERR